MVTISAPLKSAILKSEEAKNHTVLIILIPGYPLSSISIPAVSAVPNPLVPNGADIAYTQQ